ncbi:MAG: glycosyltransferase family 4 protein [Nitrospira sp.]
MNIIVFCDEDLGVSGGGSRQVIELSRALLARGHRLRLVAPISVSGSKDVRELAGAQIAWVPVLRLPVVRPLTYLFASALTLFRMIRREKPDMVLWFDSPGQSAPLWCATVMACPYVLFVNGLPSEELMGVWRMPPIRWLVQWALKCAVRRAEAVVSVCREIPLWMQREWGLDPLRWAVIRNGVDSAVNVPCDKSAARRRLGLEADRLYIGFVGGFFPWHGLDTLVEAMAIVRREAPDATLLLVGEGQTKPSLESLVRERKLEDSIRFVGRVDFGDVSSWIGASDICVVLHRPVRFYAGDSMKLWEYLACARPIVASEGEGYGDFVVQLGAGLSVKGDCAADLAEALLRLLGDPQMAERMGLAGRAAVVHAHTWDVRARELERVMGIPAIEPQHERVCA